MKRTLENYFTFEQVQNNFEPIDKELQYFLFKKLSLSSQKYGFGIRDPEKTYSGSQIHVSKRHRIQDPDPQHCFHKSSSTSNVTLQGWLV
jgi:hypothetical protein